MDDILLRGLHYDPDYFEVPTLLFDIYVISLDRIVGRVEYRFESGRDLSYYGNIGYVVYLPYRGSSYAYKATVKLMDLIKTRYPEITEIYITCNPENIASQKTIEKLGMEYVGRVDVDKKHELYRYGDKRKDIYVKYYK